jgi:hypothetical protein
MLPLLPAFMSLHGTIQLCRSASDANYVRPVSGEHRPDGL